MNIEQLEYIVEVAKTRSISSASNKLQVTVSTISQSISGLEKELGIKLFNRSRNGSIPTPEGTPIIKKAMQILNSIQEIKVESKLLSDKLCGHLRLAATPGVMPSLVNTIAWFKKEYPNIQFELSEDGSERIFEMARMDQIDLGLVSIDSKIIKEQTAGFNFELITEEKISIAVGRNSPLAFQRSVRASDLRNYTFVLYNDEHVHAFIHKLSEQEGPLHILFTTNNTAAILNALHVDLAISPAYTSPFINNIHVVNGDIVLLHVDSFDPCPLSLGWIWTRNNKSTNLSRLFIDRFKYEFNRDSLS